MNNQKIKLNQIAYFQLILNHFMNMKNPIHFNNYLDNKKKK